LLEGYEGVSILLGAAFFDGVIIRYTVLYFIALFAYSTVPAPEHSK